MRSFLKKNPALLVCMVGICIAWVLALYVVFSGKDTLPALYGLAVLMVGTGVALVLGFMVFLTKDNIQGRRKHENRQQEKPDVQADRAEAKKPEKPQTDPVAEEADYPEQEGFEFEAWGKWGISTDEDCLYEKPRNELLQALASDKPFNTGWHGFTKELESMRIIRDNAALHLFVYSYMNEDADIFSEFLSEEELAMLTEEKISAIRERLTLTDFSENVENREDLPLNASYEEILEKAEKLMIECHKTLDSNYCDCIRATMFALYGETEEAAGRAEGLISMFVPKER